MRYAPTPIRLIIGWGGNFFACSLTWRAYALAPPTPIRLIIGWSGDFFATSLTWRAYALAPPTPIRLTLGGAAISLRPYSFGNLQETGWLY